MAADQLGMPGTDVDLVQMSLSPRTLLLISPCTLFWNNALPMLCVRNLSSSLWGLRVGAAACSVTVVMGAIHGKINS